MVHPFASIWDRRLPNFAMVNQPSARVPSFFNGYDIIAGQGRQSVRPNAGASPYFGANMPSAMGLHYWPSSLGLVGAHKPPTSSHGVGPYSRLAPMDLILGQSSRPNANFVGLENASNFLAQNHGSNVPWCTK